MERRLIVESRYARNYIPKFQAEFGVAEEESDGTRVGLPSLLPSRFCNSGYSSLGSSPRATLPINSIA